MEISILRNCMPIDPILKQIRAELTRVADEGVKKSSQQFFKESIKAYGIKTPVVRAIAKTELTELKIEGKERIFSLCEELWSSGYIEESIIACEWCFSQRRQFAVADFETFERWITFYVSNWASCDTLCTASIGEFLLKYPEYVERLQKWATDDNRWVRRAAAISLILPARKGKYFKEVLNVAMLLLEDQDDMVQKGYGWLLKEACKTNEESVFNFVMKHKAHMPRTALRYAIEKMPADLKTAAMAK